MFALRINVPSRRVVRLLVAVHVVIVLGSTTSELELAKVNLGHALPANVYVIKIKIKTSFTLIECPKPLNPH